MASEENMEWNGILKQVLKDMLLRHRRFTLQKARRMADEAHNR